LLVSFDIDDMTGALAQMREEVTSLAMVMSRRPELDAIKIALTAGIATAWQRETVHGTLTVEERSLVDRLFADEIGGDAFVLGDPARQTPQPEALGAA